MGAGHAYSPSLDQRTPVHPESEVVRVGVRCSDKYPQVSCEVRVDKQPTVTIPCTPATLEDEATFGDEGHLALAQARKASIDHFLHADIPQAAFGSTVVYRFTSSEANTRWFSYRPSKWVENQEAVELVGGRQTTATPLVKTDGINSYAIKIAFEIEKDARVTGLGERYQSLDLYGKKRDTRVFEQYKDQWKTDRTYFPVPLLYVTAHQSAWGLYVETSNRIWFDLGSSNSSEIQALIEIDSPAELQDSLKVHVWDGDASNTLSKYLALTGTPEELPEWVFGLWASSNEWNTQERVLSEVRHHLELDIPIRAIVIEAWSDESTFTQWRGSSGEIRKTGSPAGDDSFEHPEDSPWPNPKEMISDFKAHGIHTILWQIPLLKARPHPTGQLAADIDAAKKENHLVKVPNSDGSLTPYQNRGWWFPLAKMPDLTDSQTAVWWTEQRRHLITWYGVEGFKTDGGEHAWGDELVYKNGKRGNEMNNLFPEAYSRAFADLLRRNGKSPVALSRAGFTGSQRQGVMWAGDENSTWEAFRSSIVAGLSSAYAGAVYWTWDLGGFSGAIPTPELYLRSTAAACFTPIMQYHSEFNHHRKPSNDRSPWNIAKQFDDPKVIDVFRCFVDIREKLIPYLTESARAAIEHRKPLMVPVTFNQARESLAWDHPNSWLLGESLFVAPVLEESANSVDIFLPEGCWVHVFSGEESFGNSVIKVQVPIDQAAVFMRKGDQAQFKGIFSAA